MVESLSWSSRVLIALSWGMIALASPLCAQDNDNGAPAPDPSQSDQQPVEDASFQTFYDSLANQGAWIQNPDYGYVWQPTIDQSDWAPYTDGHWAYTDAGWTWVSDESFGWATYHYGRWVNLDGTGWCWVPGYTWAPAWVSWRYGEGYAGWAPLPPDSLVGVDYADANAEVGNGFHIGGDCDSYYGIGAGWYNFLPIAYLGDSNYHGYYANRYDNYRLINHTTNVTNLIINRRAGHGRFQGATLGGPSLLQVNARSQTPIQRVGLAYTDRVGGGAVEGNSLALFAPRVDVNSLQGAHPQGSVRTQSHMEINRGTNLSRPLSVNERMAGIAPTGQQLRDAQAAQAAAPANAKEAAFNAPVRSHVATAFSNLRPVGITTQAGPSATQRGSSPVYANGAQLYRRPENENVYRPSVSPRPQSSQNYARPSGNSSGPARTPSRGGASNSAMGGAPGPRNSNR